MTDESIIHKPVIHVEKLEDLDEADLSDLCDATEATLRENSQSFNLGFGWRNQPSRDRIESYWKGVQLIPQRTIIVGRLDGAIAGSLQFIRPESHHRDSFAAHVDNHFVAPWARGFGLARNLLKGAEDIAQKNQLKLIKLDVRINLTAAISLYESCGYDKWGTLNMYEEVDGIMYAGNFYCKELSRV